MTRRLLLMALLISTLPGCTQKPCADPFEIRGSVDRLCVVGGRGTALRRSNTYELRAASA